MALPDNWLRLPKWEKMKFWLADKHDEAEKRHHKTLLGADAAEMGTYRKVIDGMKDMEIQEQGIANSDSAGPLSRKARGKK